MAKVEVEFDNAVAVGLPAVTLCPTGRRSKNIVERAPTPSPIKTTTATALSPKKPREIVYGMSHTRFDASKEAEETEVATLAVAMAQPHRRDAADPRSDRLGTALGRFCARPVHQGRPLADHLYLAGSLFCEVTRAYKMAIDIMVPDRGIGNGDNFDEDQAAARAALAVDRRKACEDVLTGIMPLRAIRAMDNLTYEDREPAPRDESLLVHCLVALAKHFEVEPRNIRDNGVDEL